MSNDREANQPQKPPTQGKRIPIDINKEIKPVYANVAFISHRPAEMFIDFAQLLPPTPRGSVVSRIIMTPMHAKMLHVALGQNIANYERQFGEIRLPQPSLADQLFRFPQEGSEEDEGKNNQ